MAASVPNAWIPRSLRAFVGRLLAGALNRVVRLDPETRSALARLQGRRIGVHLRGADIAFDIEVQDGDLRIVAPALDGEASKPDLRVAATPFSLLALATPRDGDALPPGKVEIAGDAELARRLEKLAREFAPDFEGAFVGAFGDVAGVPIARALRDASHWMQARVEHAGADAADWLRDDVRIAVPRGELEDFLDDVDVLRERAERLGARVKRLSGRAR